MHEEQVALTVALACGTIQNTCSDEDVPGQLERASVLGLFVRRIHLAFSRASFEEVCTVTSHFQLWLRNGEPASGPGVAAHELVVQGGTGMAWAHALPDGVNPRRRCGTAVRIPSTPRPTTRS